jgi:cation diffusion facilitator family transporter
MRRKISAEHVVGVSFLVDCSDLFFNVAVAYFTGSVVMISEALQGGADLLTTLMLWVGLKKSKRRPDATHHFGYGREIYFWTLMSAIMMLSITATLGFYFGLQRFLHPEPLMRTGLALGMLSFAIMTNGYALALSIARLRRGFAKAPLREVFFQSTLIETKSTFILDLMGTLAATFGLISLTVYLITGDPRFDGVGAMVIGVMTAILAATLAIEAKDLLIGRSAPASTEKDIREAALKTKGVDAVADVSTMYLGTEKLLVNLELDLDPDMKTESIERLTERIEQNIKEAVPTVSHVHIELEAANK